MERGEFIRVSSATLEQLEEQLADLELESLDIELAGDVLTLAFDDGTQFVINAHSAAGQIWMAANQNAWHFDYEAKTRRWIAHNKGDEFKSTLARVIGEKLGATLTLER